MGSYKQIIIGVLLIGTTAIFAWFLHEGGLNQSTFKAELVQNEVPQLNPTTDLQPEVNPLTPSLKDRILGRRPASNQETDLLELSIIDEPTKPKQQRLKATLPPPPQVDAATAASSTPAQPLGITIDPIDTIEVPDFSHLVTSITESDSVPFIAQKDPPQLLRILDPATTERSLNEPPVESRLVPSSLANEIPLPPSHDITPIRISPPKRSFPPQGKRAVRRTAGIPFGLTQQARSELVAVHKRSDQVKPATTHFLDHIAKEGDTLQSLSDQYYGRPDFYLDIYLANQDTLRNPSALPIGVTIKIPVFQN